jgi:hypothetical protein
MGARPALTCIKDRDPVRRDTVRLAGGRAHGANADARAPIHRPRGRGVERGGDARRAGISRCGAAAATLGHGEAHALLQRARDDGRRSPRLPGRFRRGARRHPGIANFVSHVVPAQHTFDFATEEEFAARARDVALAWAPQIAGKSFHVRLHRRGRKGVLSSPREERFLDDALLQGAAPACRIAFDDPDAVIQIETIDGRAGMSLWMREEMRQHPFLGAD